MQAPEPALALALLALMLLVGKDPTNLPNPATVNPELLLAPTWPPRPEDVPFLTLNKQLHESLVS